MLKFASGSIYEAQQKGLIAPPAGPSAKRPFFPARRRRKGKADAERQKILIGVHCTEAEAALITAGAEAAGLKAGRFLVDIALKKTADILQGHYFVTETKLEQLAERHSQRSVSSDKQL